jgi:Biotin-protein ligase, N terminal
MNTSQHKLHCAILSLTLLFMASGVVHSRVTQPREYHGILAKGTAWSANYHIIDSGLPGPTVMVVGGLRGEAPAVIYAASHILEWTLQRGKLIVIPQADMLEANFNKGKKRKNWKKADFKATETGELRDLNANFPTRADESPRGIIARELWQLTSETHPDWLLAMADVRYASKSIENTTRTIRPLKGVAAKRKSWRMLRAVNRTIDAATMQFTLQSAPLSSGFARAAVDLLGVQAIMIDTDGYKWNSFTSTRHLRIITHRLLTDLGMIKHGPDVLVNQQKAKGKVRVALFHGSSAIAKRLRHFPSQLHLSWVGQVDVQLGLLDQFDVINMPGGSAKRQADALEAEGIEAIRDFVRKGNGYVGHCAGAYLGTVRSSNAGRLKFIDAFTDRQWLRGKSNVMVELTPEGKRILGEREGQFEVFYANGPIMRPAHYDEVSDYIPLAYYRTEKRHKKKPQKKGIMVGTVAIAAAPFGQGRTLVSSPHPEFADRFNDFCLREMLWVAGRID